MDLGSVEIAGERFYITRQETDLTTGEMKLQVIPAHLSKRNHKHRMVNVKVGEPTPPPKKNIVQKIMKSQGYSRLSLPYNQNPNKKK